MTNPFAILADYLPECAPIPQGEKPINLPHLK
jgi:hypothetical protein